MYGTLFFFSLELKKNEEKDISGLHLYCGNEAIGVKKMSSVFTTRLILKSNNSFATSLKIVLLNTKVELK